MPKTNVHRFFDWILSTGQATSWENGNTAQKSALIDAYNAAHAQGLRVSQDQRTAVLSPDRDLAAHALSTEGPP